MPEERASVRDVIPPKNSRSQRDTEQAFVLHSYPYLETSLVIETFTRHHGRVAMVARGARRPRSVLRGVLLAFQPLLLSWAGKSELRTLHKAEWQGGFSQLKGSALLCGFYLNELMVKLLARDDPHEDLFQTYFDTLHALNNGASNAPTLRRFEKYLLKELGYALTLDHDVASGESIHPQRTYLYLIERGPIESKGDRGQNQLELLGQTLLDMEQDDYSHPLTSQQSKALMRMVINHYLGNQVLNTRQLLKDLQQL